jgi:hypothetical protein
MQNTIDLATIPAYHHKAAALQNAIEGACEVIVDRITNDDTNLMFAMEQAIDITQPNGQEEMIGVFWMTKLPDTPDCINFESIMSSIIQGWALIDEDSEVELYTNDFYFLRNGKKRKLKVVVSPG